MRKNKKTEDGSITVFLCFVFMLLMALTGALMDHARYYSSGGYMAVSSQTAAMKVFGDYNKELYEEYKLFGYGGYEGIGAAEWEDAFRVNLIENLCAYPSNSRKVYGDFYRFSGIQTNLRDMETLSEKRIYEKQLEEWLSSAAIENVAERIRDALQGDCPEKEQLMKQLEDGSEAEESQKKKSQSENKNAPKEQTKAQTKRQTKKQNHANSEKKVEEDKAGGNPLTYVKTLLQDGVLSLVCDPSKLSDQSITLADERTENSVENTESMNKDKSSKDTGAGLIQSVLSGSDGLGKEIYSAGKLKVLQSTYASEMFDCYCRETNRNQPYGQEYLIAGKRSGKDNFSSVVTRLLLIRTLANLAYVEMDPVFLEKSLATATSVSALLLAEAFIPIIQQTILIILALQEACVDVCALLSGRIVPVVKGKDNFQMHYEEICLGNRSLFQKKAKAFEKGEGKLLTKTVSKGMEYIHYLYLFLLMVPEGALRERSLDLIQDDLQQRYNQTFSVRQCICSIRGTVTYTFPFLSGAFLVSDPEKRVDPNVLVQHQMKRSISINYQY